MTNAYVVTVDMWRSSVHAGTKLTIRLPSILPGEGGTPIIVHYRHPPKKNSENRVLKDLNSFHKPDQKGCVMAIFHKNECFSLNLSSDMLEIPNAFREIFKITLSLIWSMFPDNPGLYTFLGWNFKYIQVPFLVKPGCILLTPPLYFSGLVHLGNTPPPQPPQH